MNQSPWSPTQDDEQSRSTGIILVDHGSRRVESNQLLEQLASAWQTRRGLAIIEAAHMELAAPDIASAFAACVARGATRIVISPFFLLPGRHWTTDIPHLAAQAADPFPHIPWILVAPIALHELVFSILEDRIESCLNNQNDGRGCDVCGEQIKCQWNLTGQASSS